MATIFSKIVKGEIPSFKIYEDQDHIAILDITPFRKGHTLVIPKKQYDNITEMPEEEYVELQRIVHKMVKHYRRLFKVKIGTMVYGLDVPHVHIHVFPIDEELEVLDTTKTKQYLPNEIEIYKKRLEVKDKW